MMGDEATVARPGAVGRKQIILVQHEGIVTRDTERSRDFYVRILGLEVLPRPPLQSRGYWLGTPGVYPQIHIIESDAPAPGPEAPINPRARHTCFEVLDYPALKRTLEVEGIPCVENVQPGGRLQLLCNDPDGHTLEFQPRTA
jgi:glyoxylase I family protein